VTGGRGGYPSELLFGLAAIPAVTAEEQMLIEQKNAGTSRHGYS